MIALGIITVIKHLCHPTMYVCKIPEIHLSCLPAMSKQFNLVIWTRVSQEEEKGPNVNLLACLLSYIIYLK